MENQSFDNVLGMLPHGSAAGAGSTACRSCGAPADFNLDAQGNKFFSAPADTPCQFAGVPSQAWNASHPSFDDGRNDGFVLASGPVAMRFFDDSDLPFTYSLAQALPDRPALFCSPSARPIRTSATS